MAIIGTAEIELTPNTKNFINQTTADLTKGIQKSSAKIGAISGAIAGTVTTAMQGALSSIKGFATGAVNAFAAVEDATGAAGVVFGDTLPDILEFAEEASVGFGLSKRQAIEAGNTFATFGKAAGLAGTDLSEFAIDLTGLAGDLASFKGTTTEQAIMAIGSALRGESEPIRAYGVLLDDATLKQEALSQGLITTTKEALTPQQKVLAVQAQLFKQTSDAQGDFSRTSDSTANVQKRLAAETENAQVALGEKLAPAVTAVRRAFLGAIKTLTKVIDVIASLPPGVTAGVGAFTTLAITIPLAVKAFHSLQLGILALRVAMSGMTLTFGAVGIAVAAVSTAIGFLVQRKNDATKATDGLVQAIQEETRENNKAATAWIAKELANKKSQEQLKYLGLTTKEAVGYIRGEEAATAAVTAAMEKRLDSFGRLTGGSNANKNASIEYKKTLEEMRKEFSLSAAQAELLGEVEEEVGVKLDGTAESTEALTETVEDQKSAYELLREELDAYTQKLNDALNPALNARAAQSEFNQSLEDLKKLYGEVGPQIDKNTGQISLNTEAGRKLDEAVRDVVSDSSALTEALSKNNQLSQDEITLRDDQIKRLEELKKKYPELAPTLQPFIDKLGEVKTAAEIEITVKKEAAETLINGFKGLLESIKNVDINFPSPPSWLKLPGRAGGGSVMAGQPYIVGEQGPELLVPRSNGTIIPNNQLSTVANNKTNNVYVYPQQVVFDEREMARQFKILELAGL